MMIWRVVCRLHLGELPPRLRRRLAHCAKKFFRAHVRGTRTRHEDSARVKMSDAGFDQFAVSADRARAFGFALRQRRRIKHDEIKFARRISREPREDIRLDWLMATTCYCRIT